MRSTNDVIVSRSDVTHVHSLTHLREALGGTDGVEGVASCDVAALGPGAADVEGAGVGALEDMSSAGCICK